MENCKKFIKDNAKMISLVGAALIIVGCFLPFMKITVSFLGISKSETVTFMDEGKWQAVVTLIMGAASALLVYLNRSKLTSVSGLVALVLTLWKGFDMKGQNTMGLGTISFSYGFYIIVLGAVALLAVVVVDFMNSKKSIKEYYGSEIDACKKVIDKAKAKPEEKKEEKTEEKTEEK